MATHAPTIPIVLQRRRKSYQAAAGIEVALRSSPETSNQQEVDAFCLQQNGTRQDDDCVTIKGVVL
jgi:hypothetical protein